MTKKHLELLGLKVKDAVTGFEGVVSTISFDLYGCIQAVVSPQIDRDGKKGDGHWFDIARLKITDIEPVMKLPDYDLGYVADGLKGCAEKP